MGASERKVQKERTNECLITPPTWQLLIYESRRYKREFTAVTQQRARIRTHGITPRSTPL